MSVRLKSVAAAAHQVFVDVIRFVFHPAAGVAVWRIGKIFKPVGLQPQLPDGSE